MVRAAGLACQFLVSKAPVGSPVTDRAIPVAIFQADWRLRVKQLRKWTGNRQIDAATDLREVNIAARRSVCRKLRYFS